jgi:hypothetical protein
MDVRHRNGKIDPIHIAACNGRQVSPVHTPPHHQPGLQLLRGDGINHLAFRLAHHRHTHFQLGNARRHQRMRNGYLLLGGERHPRRLLAIAQRRIVDRHHVAVLFVVHFVYLSL